MHEHSLLARATERMLDGAGPAPVTRVLVTVGPRADREVVEIGWAILVRDTPLALASVRFEEVSDEMRCLSCLAEYAGSTLDRCPTCGGDGLAQGLALDVSVAAEPA